MLPSSRMACNRVELNVSLEQYNVPWYLLGISDVVRMQKTIKITLTEGITAGKSNWWQMYVHRHLGQSNSSDVILLTLLSCTQ